ncbi:dopamine receptor 2-like [Montipora foliosa]|uniref:dopamine receptor 2-like n=1 Tax=Montipora foliosa TaxID=591990 RepID=UPI0035F10E72
MERFTPYNLFYTQMFINYVSSKDPRSLEFSDEAGIKIPDVGTAYGHIAKGSRCVEMANDQNGTVTPTLEPFSSSACIAWLTVLNIEAVAIVTMNALTIFIYLKERILRKRSMYLVISLAVADMFVTYNLIVHILWLGNNCNFWTIKMSRPIFSLEYFFPSASVINLAAISLERMHATFRPFKHRLIKKKIFGAVVAGVWFTAALSTAILFPSFFLGRSDITAFFHLKASHLSLGFCWLLIIVVSYTSIATKVHCGTHPQHHAYVLAR